MLKHSRFQLLYKVVAAPKDFKTEENMFIKEIDWMVQIENDETAFHVLWRQNIFNILAIIFFFTTFVFKCIPVVSQHSHMSLQCSWEVQCISNLEYHALRLKLTGNNDTKISIETGIYNESKVN